MFFNFCCFFFCPSFVRRHREGTTFGGSPPENPCSTVLSPKPRRLGRRQRKSPEKTVVVCNIPKKAPLCYHAMSKILKRAGADVPKIVTFSPIPEGRRNLMTKSSRRLGFNTRTYRKNQEGYTGVSPRIPANDPRTIPSTAPGR